MIPKFIKLDSFEVPVDTTLENLVQMIHDSFPGYEIVGTLSIRNLKKYKYATGFLRRLDLSEGDKLAQDLYERI